MHGVPTSYGLGFWRWHLFPERAGARRGASKVYVRGSDSGAKDFCPDCGSTVLWYSESFPDLIGIAFGAFADPSMPWPPVSVWETTRHPWVTFDHDLLHFGRQPELVEGPATARR